MSGSVALSLEASEKVWTKPILTGELSGDFLPNRLIFYGWDQLREFFDRLSERPVTSKEEFEKILLDLSDLEALLHDAHQNMAVLSALNPEHRATVLFERNLENNKYLWDAARQSIYQRLCEMPWLYEDARYARLAEIVENLADLFDYRSYSIENRDRWLSAELERLEGRIDKARASCDESDVSDSQYWRAERALLRTHARELNGLMTELISVRNERAQSSGCATFADYMLRQQDTVAYTSHELQEAAAAVLDTFAPLVRDVLRLRGDELEIKRWRPWTDADTDVLYREELNQQEVLEARLEEFLGRLSPGFLALFQDNRQRASLDLYSREEKLASPFVSTFTRPDGVFLCTNLDGTATSLTAIFHETAHMIESFAALSQPYHYYRNTPRQTSEAFAHASELIATKHYDLFYDQVNREPAALLLLGEHILAISKFARETLFELWLYEEGKEAPGKVRAQYWNGLETRGGALTDWSGYEKYRQLEYLGDISWFLRPFDRSIYLVGAIASFQIFSNYLRDPKRTAEKMLRGMSAGDSLPLGELYNRAGVPFRFDRQYIVEIAGQVSQVWRDTKQSL